MSNPTEITEIEKNNQLRVRIKNDISAIVSQNNMLKTRVNSAKVNLASESVKAVFTTEELAALSAQLPA